MALRRAWRRVQERMMPLRVGGRFANRSLGAARDEAAPDARFRDFLRWRRERRARVLDAPFDVPRAQREGPLAPAPREGVAATWVGHSSVVLQVDGRTYLTDPVWSGRIGFGTVPRLTPPGVLWEDLPRVDAVLLSHNHYDHMDAPTLRRLPRETPVVCPTGVGAWLRRRGFSDVRELTWWERTELDGHGVTLVPARHFSGRTAWDRNRSLWGGHVVEGDRGSRAYFVGDSGYFPGFGQVGEAFPGLDLVLMPIGAYEPRWFMEPVHVDPEQAGQAFLDTGGRTMLPIHWGTFRLADEPVDEPPRALRAWWARAGLAPERLLAPALGETVRVPRAAARKPEAQEPR